MSFSSPNPGKHVDLIRKRVVKCATMVFTPPSSSRVVEHNSKITRRGLSENLQTILISTLSSSLSKVGQVKLDIWLVVAWGYFDARKRTVKL